MNHHARNVGRGGVVLLAVAVLAMLGGCRAATVLLESPVESDDGLGLRLDVTGKVAAVTFDGEELPGQLGSFIIPSVLTQGGFYMRGTNDPLEFRKQFVGSVTMDDTGAADLAGSIDWLEMKARIVSGGDYLVASGLITRPAGNDAAVTVGFCLPINAVGWYYGKSILASETIKPLTRSHAWIEPANGEDKPAINRGLFAPIYNETQGIALGLSGERVRPFRVHYRDTEGFTIEIDLPAEATTHWDFTFVIFRFDPKKSMNEPYRAALAKHTRLFPAPAPGWASALRVDASRTWAWDDKPDLEQLAFAQELAGPGSVETVDVPFTAAQADLEQRKRHFQEAMDLSVLFAEAPRPRAAPDLMSDKTFQFYAKTIAEMSAAGWEPLTAAVVAHPDLLVERYGGPGDKKVFYAVHNRGDERVTFELAADLKAAGIDPAEVRVRRCLYDSRPEATVLEGFLVVRTSADPHRTTLLQVSTEGGVKTEPGKELTTPLTPAPKASE